MSKRKIKLCLIPQYLNDTETLLRLLRLNEEYESGDFEIDNEAPDYVVVTDLIYYVPECAKQFKRLVYKYEDEKRPVTIFFTEECASADFNMFDYTVCYNWDLKYSDRAARIPPHIFIGYSPEKFINDLTKKEAMRLLREGKSDFCNFLYSNLEPLPFRDDLFYAMSSYKHVDSLGRWLNNTGTLITPRGGGGLEEAGII